MRNMHRQVLILAGSQAIFQSISVLIMTIGGLAGALLTSSPALMTVPLSMASLGTVLVMFPASLWMSRTGRKPGFLTGALSGMVSAAIAMMAMIHHSFLLLCLSMFFLGVYQAFAQFYRFAAGEVSLPACRTHAISLVLAGGVVAALLGPFLASRGSTLFSVPYVGSFLFMGIMASVGLLLLSRLQMPVQAAEFSAEEAARPWKKVVSQPAYLVALFSGASGFGIMVLGLTATPIAMKHEGFTLASIAAVVQLHILGRFIPSFFTGKLIDRFGVINLMLAGILLMLAYMGLAFSGATWGRFAVALILMGIGWNFLYIGGTSLLATTYTSAEKGVAQAANDMSVFIFSLLCSLGAGPLLNTFGWKLMHLLLVPWALLLAVPLLWLARQKKRYPPAADEAGLPLP
ncbi:MFS transporter [Nissabacter archeti]|uniref:MFS transporter n=1 Tax=Nissabacter archeti TaxID=1917880 RepID=UPI0009339E67|nr:MFS transporter [Nissabacter archeti]